MKPPDSQETSDQLLDRTLRELPVRRAPATLESRVLGELHRRAALPWWRRSFAHWPVLARIVFLAICGASMRVALLGNASAADVSLSLLHHVGVLAAVGGNLAAFLARAALPAWFYAGIGVCTVLYAALFGLGAAAYRTLYLQHSGDQSYEYFYMASAGLSRGAAAVRRGSRRDGARGRLAGIG